MTKQDGIWSDKRSISVLEALRMESDRGCALFGAEILNDDGEILICDNEDRDFINYSHICLAVNALPGLLNKVEELEERPELTWTIWIPPGCGGKRQLHLKCGGIHIGQRWDGECPPANDLERYMQKLLDTDEGSGE